MRNLKKIVAVLCVVAMMASIAIVPALAAGFTYETEATTLNTLGLMAGMNLGDEVTRIQGLTFAIKAAGKDAAAQALTDAEVATILANVTDAADVPAWGLKYAAYAVQNGLTTGVDAAVAPKVKFAPLQGVSGDSMLVWILKSMGYTDAGTATAWETSVTTAKVLSLTQGYAFHAKTTLIRDDVAGILFGAAKTGVNKDGTSFIKSLIDVGFVDAQKAADAGLYTIAPTTVGVVSATATNLKEIVVVFNTELDKDSAENEDNYKVSDDDLGCTATLGADKKTVTLLMDDALTNQTDYTVAISGIKGTNGTTIAAVTKTVAVLDNTMPTVVSVKAVGSGLLKVTFSEPVTPDSATDLANYTIDGDLFAAEVTMDGAEAVNIDLVDALAAGTYTLKIDNVVDFFDYKLAVNDTKFVVAADTVKATATVKSASQTELKLTFSEEIDSYGDITCDDATPTGNELDTDLITLTVDFGRDDPMPVEGTKVTIKDVTDFSGNKGDVVVTVKPTPDETRPTFVSVAMDGQDTIKVTFSENIYIDNIIGNEDDFFVLKDKDANVISLEGVANVEYDVNDDGEDVETVLVLTASEVLDPGTYTLLIKDVEDMSPLANKILSKTVSVTVADKTAPEISAVYTNANDKLFVEFDSEVTESLAEDLGNYSVVVPVEVPVGSGNFFDFTKVLSKDPSAAATLLADKKTVQLAWDLDADNTWLGDIGDVTAIDNLNVEDVTDLAGNEMDQYSCPVAAFDAIVTPEIAAVEVTGKNTIKLTIEDGAGNPAPLLSTSVVPGDYMIYQDTDDDGLVDAGDLKLTAVKAVYAQDDDTDVVTVTLTTSTVLDPEGTSADHAILVYTKDAPKAKNVLGESLVPIELVAGAGATTAEDYYAPAFDKIADISAGGATPDEIHITFTENLVDTATANDNGEFVVKVNGKNVTGVAGVTMVVTDNELVITLADALAKDDKVIVQFNPIDGTALTDDTGNANELGEFTATTTVKE